MAGKDGMAEAAAGTKGRQADERYRAPALDKGLDILELLSEQPRGLTRGEIVKAMGRGPSEIYRMLERLVARDYVSRSAEGDRYALTMKLFLLAHHHPPVRRLVTRALPLMDAFARQAQQSCHLVVPDRDAAIVIAQATCPGNWEFGIRVGSRVDLLGTGSGRTLLAFQDPHATEDASAMWNSAARRAELASLHDELEESRRLGYRIGRSRQIQGIDDISVPIRAPGGHAIAVLTCPYILRLDGQHQPSGNEVLDLLSDVADRLSVT